MTKITLTSLKDYIFSYYEMLDKLPYPRNITTEQDDLTYKRFCFDMLATHTDDPYPTYEDKKDFWKNLLVNSQAYTYTPEDEESMFYTHNGHALYEF